MPLRVLLISLNRCTAPDPVFPLGLAHLGGALKVAGHETLWYDVLVEKRPLEEVLATFQPQVAGVSIRNIDDVLIRKQETYFDSLGEICRTIHETARCPVVLGGSGFSIFPQELMKFSGADFGVCGAGEEPFLELLERLERNEPALDIPGVVIRKENGLLFGSPAHEPHQRPAHKAEFPAEIVSHYLGSGGMLNIQTQRGCACHCCYCTYPVIEGRAHRRQSAEAVADDFQQIQDAGSRYAFIVDSVFNSSARHVSDICEAILRRGIKISWGCFLRPHGLTAELMKLMRRAGLSHIEFGSDSFCDEVLASYRKGFTFIDIVHSSELARQEKIDFCHFLIAGGPGETAETLRQGFQNSRELQEAVMMAVVGMRIYPGTSLCQRALSEGVITKETDLLKPVYYVAPGLSPDAVFKELQDFARNSPNWIVGDPVPGFARLVERLRRRGVMGPLWSYLSIIQRFWPSGTGALPGHAAATAAK